MEATNATVIGLGLLVASVVGLILLLVVRYSPRCFFVIHEQQQHPDKITKSLEITEASESSAASGRRTPAVASSSSEGTMMRRSPSAETCSSYNSIISNHHHSSSSEDDAERGLPSSNRNQSSASVLEDDPPRLLPPGTESSEQTASSLSYGITFSQLIAMSQEARRSTFPAMEVLARPSSNSNSGEVSITFTDDVSAPDGDCSFVSGLSFNWHSANGSEHVVMERLVDRTVSDIVTTIARHQQQSDADWAAGCSPSSASSPAIDPDLLRTTIAERIRHMIDEAAAASSSSSSSVASVVESSGSETENGETTNDKNNNNSAAEKQPRSSNGSSAGQGPLAGSSPDRMLFFADGSDDDDDDDDDDDCSEDYRHDGRLQIV